MCTIIDNKGRLCCRLFVQVLSAKGYHGRSVLCNVAFHEKVLKTLTVSSILVFLIVELKLAYDIEVFFMEINKYYAKDADGLGSQ